MELKKIQLKKRLWNTEAGQIISVDEARALFATRKGYAVEIKAEPIPIKNKAEKAPKNK